MMQNGRKNILDFGAVGDGKTRAVFDAFYIKLRKR